MTATSADFMHVQWEKRLDAVLSVLHSDEYIMLKVCQALDGRIGHVSMPPGPDHTNASITKRKWEKAMASWRCKIKLSMYFRVWASMQD